MYRDWPSPRVLTTAKVREMLTRKRYRGRLWIETATGEFGHRATLPLDPWVLGVLLGDGALSRLCISTDDAELLARFADRLGPELRLVSNGGVDYRIRRVATRWQKGVQGVVPNPVREGLRALGLHGKRSHEKFIPPMYLSASREARLDLLRGLIDTDGWVEDHGSVCFGTTSEQLAHDVATLTRSLGGICRIRPPRRKFAVNGGERKEGRPAYVLTITVDDPSSVMSLDRKRLKAMRARKSRRRLTFGTIEPTRVTQTQCIAVTHPDQTYITDEYIVTHNTSLALGVAANAALKFGAKIAVFSLEMSKGQLAARLLATESGVDTTRLRTARLTEAESRKLGQAFGLLVEAPIYIDDTPGVSVTNLRARTRRLHAHVDLDLVIVDHLQLMTSGRSGENRVQEMAEISRQLKGLARELHVPVLALSQLSRAVESRSPKVPILSDLRESGSIEQDADVVIFIYRDDYYNKDSEKQGIAELHIAKHRNGPTGQISLLFNNRTTKFLDLEVYRE
jgi:replicative DNA helicase